MMPQWLPDIGSTEELLPPPRRQRLEHGWKSRHEMPNVAPSEAEPKPSTSADRAQQLWPDTSQTAELLPPPGTKSQRDQRRPPPQAPEETKAVAKPDTWLNELSRQRAADFTTQLQEDASQWALRPKDPQMLEHLCRNFFTGLEEAHAPSTIRQDKSAWKHWCQWCEELNTTPIRSDLRALSGLDQFGLQREAILQAAAVIHWMPTIVGRGRPQGLPSSCGKRLDGVRRVHERMGLPSPPRRLVTLTIKAEMRRYARRHGPEWLEPNRKNPIPLDTVRALICLCTSPDSWSRRDWSRATWLVVETLIATMTQTGFRKSEVTSSEPGQPALSRWHLRWLINGKHVHAPTKQQLLNLVSGRDMAVLKPPPSKSDPFGQCWGAKLIYLPLDERDQLNAAARLRDLELEMVVPTEKRRETPLFPGPEGRTFTASALDGLLRDMLAELVEVGLLTAPDAKHYSWHSFRAAFATALWAAGCSVPEIQAAVRWITPESVSIYAAFTPEDYSHLVQRAMRQDIAAARRNPRYQEVEDATFDEERHVSAMLQHEF